MKTILYPRYIKRLMDIILSSAALVVLSPILAVLAVLVRIKLGVPILFKQKRPGLNEKVFVLYKFRTMTEEKDALGRLLPDDKRMTRFGSFLRSTSLDELPQLINILKGDLSIIGPRPLLVSYLPLYSEKQRLRHLVRPGLVGLAGVRGRNNQSWEDKFAADIYYVKNISLKLDCKIFFLAVLTVVKRTGINQEGTATTKPFTGNN